jgi:hypothetical protein
VIDKGEVQAVAAKAAEYPRNVLRFIFMLQEYSSVAGGDFYPLAGRLAKTKK